jgi:hypothetical protein
MSQVASEHLGESLGTDFFSSTTVVPAYQSPGTGLIPGAGDQPGPPAEE